MIQAFPKHHHRVVAQNHCRAQQAQGIVWFGGQCQPMYTVVKLATGEKPISLEGYDLILHEGQLAAYGDKKLLRHSIDCQIDQQNRLFFPSLSPGCGLGLLVKWLIRKSGLRFTPAEQLRIIQQFDPRHLYGWAQAQPDLFNPKNTGYLVYGEPGAAQGQAILTTHD